MSDVPKQAKVVVIGAGIVGNCLVGHLARLGWTEDFGGSDHRQQLQDGRKENSRDWEVFHRFYRYDSTRRRCRS